MTPTHFLRIIAPLLYSILFVGFAAHAQKFDPEELQLKASDLLGADRLSGPHYRIDELVVSKGHMNQYRITSNFGEFTAKSDDELSQRINEIAAIVELQKITKSQIFTTAMLDTAKKPVQMIENVVTDPVGAVKGIPAGVNRLFKRTVRVVGDTAGKTNEFIQNQTNKTDAEDGAEGDDKSTVDKGLESGEKYSKKYLGYNSSIRKLSKDLGVDPYSSNQVLQEEMGNLAWAMTAGSFLTGKAMPSIPKEVSYMGDLNELVWETDPLDLRLLNEGLMRKMDASEELIKSFYDNENYSTTMSTRLVGSLDSMPGTQGRSLILEQAALAETIAEAHTYVKIAAILGIQHQSSPVARILGSSIWPMAQTATGTLIFIVPVDYAVWTESVSVAVNKLTIEAQNAGKNGVREIWIVGRVSDLARASLESLGWNVTAQFKPGP